MDIPDARKVHDRPIPRLGGLRRRLDRPVFGGARGSRGAGNCRCTCDWPGTRRAADPAGVDMGRHPSVGPAETDRPHPGAVIAVARNLARPWCTCSGVPIEIDDATGSRCCGSWGHECLQPIDGSTALGRPGADCRRQHGRRLRDRRPVEHGRRPLVPPAPCSDFFPTTSIPRGCSWGDTGATAIGFCLAAFASGGRRLQRVRAVLRS